MALWDHDWENRANPAWPRDGGANPASAVPPLPEFLRSRVNPPRSSNDNRDSQLEDVPAYELDCLRRVLAPELIHAAERRSRELGIGADQVLIHWGVIDEAAYLRRLSFHIGVEIETYADLSRYDCPLSDSELAYAATHGIVPLRVDGQSVLTFAPRNLTTRTLCRLIEKYPALKPQVRLAPSSSVQQFLTQQGNSTLAYAATRGLSEKFPTMSAAPVSVDGLIWWQRLKRGGCVAAIAVLPPLLTEATWSVLAVWFLAFVGLRVAGCFWPQETLPAFARLADAHLPTYTIIVALYREASSVAPLIQAINALDYPREKLDFILIIEPDDLQTRAAIARLGAMPHVQVLIAPSDAPKTKPKALNYALPFARGSFIAVFDAEDRPEPNQLRAALDVFRHYGDDCACAQASLCIDNKTHTLLSRMFEAEYAGQFDGFLPGMAAMGLPLPLGGSSNHFRATALREAGGWDAYNVTEDADLGFRLARRGYRSVMFASTTFEEAPIRFGAWLRQRTRWMKGWVQTWFVHMRHPLQLGREAGPLGFCTLNIIVGGNVLTALALPFLFYALLRHSWIGVVAGEPAGSLAVWPSSLHATAIAAGLLSTVVVSVTGLARRGRLGRAWILMMTLPYWICLSVAAWRAVFQFIWKPYHWEKTEHGLAQRTGPSTLPMRLEEKQARQR